MNIIDKAMADLPGHWYKGGIGDDYDNFCGIGHVLNQSSIYFNSRGNAIKLMHEIANEQYPDRSIDGFGDFNDHPDTTEEEVLAVMQKASIRLDELVE